ncbi:zinc-dependent metalloprotease [Subsaxibacter sp. CAU 1640]|uniref:T9SS type A sorting domain-containing protein n=1 Tax=Subsaxibacter sp. CAU 1640 TaxID=2933271 RepID=UPI002004514F|nr:T9SS type A sorting domain-containing protein [Subsaxibacter sp. CAU 1640]MCK7589281.1 zinc-dependent metalloprotease [Subsaxibacter sp. CAU 1640]
MIRTITHNAKNVLFAAIFALSCSFLSAQERTCGMDAYMQQQMTDPEFVREYEANQLKFREELEKVLQRGATSNRRNPVVIPVAVHFPTGNEANRACLEALAQNQVDILNKDYTATNTDISLWNAASVFYPGVNLGSINYYFCLATINHPTNTDTDLVEGGPAVTIGWPFGGAGGSNTDSRWSGYMNFVIRNISDLGFSPLGGSIAAGQAVTMDNNAFGSGAGCAGFAPGAPYNLGRTVTHELGHFYNLNHTFGNTNGCGADDDGLADTPQVAAPTFGCPSNGSVNGCVSGQKALTMNYMDYTNDACMYMFTAGQAAVMDAYLNVLQAQFKPNVTECTFGPNFTMVASNSPQTACPSAGSVTYNFTFTSQEGFNENTVFSAMGQPAAASVTFNPTSRSTTGPFTMTVSNLGSAPISDYTITVTGTSTSITNTQNVVLNLRNTPCTSNGNMSFNTSTTGVTFNTINNLNSGKSAGGYGNFTGQVTTVNRNSTYALSVRVNTDGNYPTQTKVWIDWNQNCSFGDSGEEYILGNAANVTNGLTSASPYSITVPVGATLGNTVMRVATKYVNTDDPGLPMACLTGYDGETEDYTLNVDVQLGVDEFGLDNFSIYPNPNKGQFNISLNSGSNDNVKVTVYDMRGRKVYENAFENSSNFNQVVKMNNVQSGMYLVKVSDGQKQATKKIIVE